MGDSFDQDRAEYDPEPGGVHNIAHDGRWRVLPRCDGSVYRVNVDAEKSGDDEKMLNVQKWGLMRRTGAVKIDARSASSS